jgi:multiple sugar transport system substrate-binding protein
MKNGLLDPVPADMASDAQNRYYQAPLAGYTFKGTLYGIAREYNIENGGVLYYPEDLKKVGYSEFPKTFDQLMDAAKKLSKQDASGNPEHLGFDFISIDNIPYLFLSFILQQGGDYWKEDKIHVNFTSPEAQKAMQTMVDMVVKDKVTEVNHLNDANNESHTMFYKGLSSMCYRGPWVIPVGLNDFKLNNFQYGAMPSFTGNSNAFAAESGWGDVVSARSKNKEAAWLFIKFITSKENNELWNSVTYTIPSEKDIAEDPAYIQKNPMIKTSLDMLQYGKPIGPMQSIDSFKNTVCNHFVSMCSGSDVKSELQKMEQEMNSIIDEKLAQ